MVPSSRRKPYKSESPRLCSDCGKEKKIIKINEVTPTSIMHFTSFRNQTFLFLLNCLLHNQVGTTNYHNYLIVRLSFVFAKYVKKKKKKKK